MRRSQIAYAELPSRDDFNPGNVVNSTSHAIREAGFRSVSGWSQARFKKSHGGWHAIS
jgi:hypothetical protein